jgi:chorismate dehydratase
VKIGSVPFLNALPLHLALGEPVMLHPPVVLAKKLAQGEVDAALVPVVECLRNAGSGYVLVDGVAIASRGPVESVILALAEENAPIRSVALDRTSVTSAALTRVLLEKYRGLRPEYRAEGQPADAQLWIGDRALEFRRSRPDAAMWDLGGVWQQATGLPFVYALWAVRSEAATTALAQALREAKEKGLRRRGEIAANAAELRYLTESIRYDLGKGEKEGLLRFARDLVELGILNQVPELTWI